MASTLNLFNKKGQSQAISIPASVFSTVNLSNTPAQISSDVWTVIARQSDPFTVVAGTVVNKAEYTHTLT